MNAFLAAIRFLTVAPVPGRWGTAEADLARSVAYFALVGALLGAIASAAAWAAAKIAPPLVVAAAVVVILASFSGGLHLDGLSDTADGFLSSRSRERILEIMRDSHVGAMGVFVIVAAMLMKFAALASLSGDSLWRAVLLMPLAGRTAIVLHMASSRYARESGLGLVFYRRRQWPAALVAAGLLTAIAWPVAHWRGLILTAATVALGVVWSLYARSKIGGATGDTFGAVCELAEIVPPLVLALAPVALDPVAGGARFAAAWGGFGP